MLFLTFRSLMHKRPNLNLMPGVPSAQPKTGAGQPTEPGSQEAAQASDRHLPLQTQHQVLSKSGKTSFKGFFTPTILFNIFLRCQCHMPLLKMGRSIRCQYT